MIDPYVMWLISTPGRAKAELIERIRLMNFRPIEHNNRITPKGTKLKRR